MAGKRITMETARNVFRTLVHTGSIHKTSRVLGISRNTIRKQLKLLDSAGVSIEEASLLDYTQLNELLNPIKESEPTEKWLAMEQMLPGLLKDLGHKHVTKQLLWEEYRLTHSDGYGYTQFCKHLGEYASTKDVVARFNHEPGELLEVDFAGDRLCTVDPLSGERIPREVLVCTLAYSKYCYVEALESARQEDFIAGMVRAFAFFGGVPKLVKFDNMRVAVTKPDRYSPDFTLLVQQLAEHYQTTCTTARVGKPRDKPNVEASVNWAYTRIYARMRKSSYATVKELNADIWKYLDEFLGREFQRRTETRHDLFVHHELPHLLPLPAESFRPKKVRRVKVRANSHVIISEDNHFYSVPFQLVGRHVRVVYDTHFVGIYYDYDLVATHVRSRSNLGYTTNRDHLPAHLIAVYGNRAMTADDFLDRARAIGPNAFIVLERIIASKAFPAQTHSSCEGFLRLAGTFGKDQLELACVKAASIPGGSSYSIVRDIVKKGPVESTKSFKVPLHDNVRGAAAFS